MSDMLRLFIPRYSYIVYRDRKIGHLMTTEIPNIFCVKLILHLSYNKFFKYVDWLQSEEFLETQKLFSSTANQRI